MHYLAEEMMAEGYFEDGGWCVMAPAPSLRGWFLGKKMLEQMMFVVKKDAMIVMVGEGRT